MILEFCVVEFLEASSFLNDTGFAGFAKLLSPTHVPVGFLRTVTAGFGFENVLLFVLPGPKMFSSSLAIVLFISVALDDGRLEGWTGGKSLLDAAGGETIDCAVLTSLFTGGLMLETGLLTGMFRNGLFSGTIPNWFLVLESVL